MLKRRMVEFSLSGGLRVSGEYSAETSLGLRLKKLTYCYSFETKLLADSGAQADPPNVHVATGRGINAWN